MGLFGYRIVPTPFGRFNPPAPFLGCPLYLSYMKYIISESQYEKYKSNRLWILRRLRLVRFELQETYNYVNPCEFETEREYESFFFNVLMDGLHAEYYLNDNFDYEGVKTELMDLFYVPVIEGYHARKRNCL